MPKSSPLSLVPVPEVPTETQGRALIALAVGVAVTVGIGNFAPPARHWAAPLAAAAAAAAWRGLRQARPQLPWWTVAGLMLGFAACAIAPRTPLGWAGRTEPMRFRGTIRDGWTSGTRGWGTRVKIERLETTESWDPHPAELRLYVGGELALAGLPAAGSCVEGAGEIVFDAEMPLRQPHLRAKSVILLRPAEGIGRVDRVRDAIMRGLLRAADVDPARIRAAGLAAALVVGRTEMLMPGEVASLRRSGLVHILAVSGMNVGMVAALAWGVMIAAGVSPRARRWALLPVVIGFALLAGGDAPVRRAAFALFAYLVARQIGRPLATLPTVWAVVALLLVLEPAAMLSAGFQLSAAVTLAILRWADPLTRAILVVPRWLAGAVAVSLVAHGASAPLVGANFGTLPMLGAFVNVGATPLAFVMTALALLAALVAPVSAWAGAGALQLVAVTQSALDWLSTIGERGVTTFPALPPAVAAIAVCAGLAALVPGRRALVAALTLVAATFAWVLTPVSGRPGAANELRVLPVREGMALLFRSGRSRVLVDTGIVPDQAARALADLRIGRLDALVITHPDADHVGGAEFIIKRLKVGALLFPAVLGERPELVEARRAARVRGVAETPLVRGARARFGEIQIDVLWPSGEVTGSSNNESLVAAVRMGGIRVLVTGDIEAPGERALLECGQNLRADVLQLPHHGSRTSSTPAFLVAAFPAVALAATGTRPRFPYPHPAVAARVRGLPAVLVSQSGGVDRVEWRSGEWIDVRTSVPVHVRVRKGGPRD